MNVKAVIDTNVLVSAYWTRNSDSSPARVYRALFSGTVTALVNDEIISEYRDVLHRPKFGFNAEDIDKDIAPHRIATVAWDAYDTIGNAILRWPARFQAQHPQEDQDKGTGVNAKKPRSFEGGFLL